VNEDQLFLCIDGGGTKTEAVLADTGGRVLGYSLSGGSNALSVGNKEAVRAVMDAVRGALGSTELERISAAYLFIPGFSQCLPLSLPFPVKLLDDAVNAYYGAMVVPGGIVLLAGTGSFAVSCKADGTVQTIGGWGPALGDEGSGYDIGRLAIRNALGRFDRNETMTLLDRAVTGHFGLAEPSKLIGAVYRRGCDREYIAKLCMVVAAHARAGEADALDILYQAAAALSKLAVTLQTRLGMAVADVALTGGVAEIGEPLTAPLRQMLSRSELTLRPAFSTPSVGGILFACRDLAGIPADRRLAAAYQNAYNERKTMRA